MESVPNCITMTSIQAAQQQYISEWHDSFVNYIGGVLSVVEMMENILALLMRIRRALSR